MQGGNWVLNSGAQLDATVAVFGTLTMDFSVAFLSSSSFQLHLATWKADEKAGTVALILDHEEEGLALGIRK